MDGNATPMLEEDHSSSSPQFPWLRFEKPFIFFLGDGGSPALSGSSARAGRPVP